MLLAVKLRVFSPGLNSDDGGQPQRISTHETSSPLCTLRTEQLYCSQRLLGWPNRLLSRVIIVMVGVVGCSCCWRWGVAVSEITNNVKSNKQHDDCWNDNNQNTSRCDRVFLYYYYFSIQMIPIVDFPNIFPRPIHMSGDMWPPQFSPTEAHGTRQAIAVFNNLGANVGLTAAKLKTKKKKK